LKKAAAEAQKLIKTKKSEFWADFVETIDENKPTTSLWNKINRIKGGKLKTGIRKLVIGH
jgi:hypothetical protein